MVFRRSDISRYGPVEFGIGRGLQYGDVQQDA